MLQQAGLCRLQVAPPGLIPCKALLAMNSTLSMEQYTCTSQRPGNQPPRHDTQRSRAAVQGPAVDKDVAVGVAGVQEALGRGVGGAPIGADQGLQHLVPPVGHDRPVVRVLDVMPQVRVGPTAVVPARQSSLEYMRAWL